MNKTPFYKKWEKVVKHHGYILDSHIEKLFDKATEEGLFDEFLRESIYYFKMAPNNVIYTKEDVVMRLKRIKKGMEAEDD